MHTFKCQHKLLQRVMHTCKTATVKIMLDVPARTLLRCQSVEQFLYATLQVTGSLQSRNTDYFVAVVQTPCQSRQRRSRTHRQHNFADRRCTVSDQPGNISAATGACYRASSFGNEYAGCKALCESLLVLDIMSLSVLLPTDRHDTHPPTLCINEHGGFPCSLFPSHNTHRFDAVLTSQRCQRVQMIGPDAAKRYQPGNRQAFCLGEIMM